MYELFICFRQTPVLVAFVEKQKLLKEKRFPNHKHLILIPFKEIYLLKYKKFANEGNIFTSLAPLPSMLKALFYPVTASFKNHPSLFLSKQFDP